MSNSDYPEFPWSRKGHSLQPGSQGADDLHDIITILGGMQDWLSSVDTVLMDEVQDGLWKALCNLRIEFRSYNDLRADSVDRGAIFFKELSLITDSDTLKGRIQEIMDNPDYPDIVKYEAKMFLKKLK